MICYICSNPATSSILVHDHMAFSYCDEHRAEVTIGISHYVLKGNLDKIEELKDKYVTKYKGAAYNEFEKVKAITEKMEDDDSSVTEQPI